MQVFKFVSPKAVWSGPGRLKLMSKILFMICEGYNKLFFNDLSIEYQAGRPLNNVDNLRKHLEISVWSCLMMIEKCFF